MAYLKFALQLSVDSIGLLRTLFWFPICLMAVLLRKVLSSIGYKHIPDQNLEYGDCPYGTSKNGLRIMFTPSDNNAGSGAFRCMVELASLLRTRHKVEPFIVLPCEGTGTQLLIDMNLPFVYVRSYGWTVPLGTNMRQWGNAKSMVMSILRNFSSVMEMRHLIRKYSVDVVHINTTWTYVGALAAMAERVAYIWHLREHLEEGLSRTMWSRSMGNRLIASSEKVIAISKCIADKYFGVINKARLLTIYDGVDKERFYCPAHEIMSARPYIFVFLGNFNRHKGQIEFSKACAQLFNEGVRDFKIWFIGAGDYEVRSECETIFDQSGMKDIVSYLGFQKNPEKFLEKADVAFTCSQFEGWGRVTAEAMMAGCLAVGSDTGATPELITDGVSGYIFHYEPKQCESLANVIKKLLYNMDESKKLAENGRAKAASEMTSVLNADKVFDVYKALGSLCASGKST